MILLVRVKKLMVMNIKVLKKIRKYWDYKFCDGKLFMRRKSDGRVDQSQSIESFLAHYIGENMGFMRSIRWYGRKKSIADKKLWNKITACK